MNFTPLYIRSGYSFLKSGLTIERIFKKLKSENYINAAITDFNVLFGVPSFVSEAKKNNIHPIIGLETILEIESLKLNICLYATNEEGYLNLVKISSYLSLNSSLNLEYLKQNSNHLICIISTYQNDFKSFILKSTLENRRLLECVSSIFSEFYLGLEIYGLEDKDYADKVREFVKEYNYNLVAFPRMLYTTKSDAITLKIVNALEKDEKLDINELDGVNYIYSYNELKCFYEDNELELSNEIAKKCDVNLNKKRGNLLKYPTSSTSDELLKEKTYLSLKEYNLENKEYIERLEYELNVIKNMGYSDYFLIVSDYVSYAKRIGIPVGPGRGSAASSLVAFLLNITTVNPLKYDLLFESFLNPARSTMPDIDIDFGDIRRDEVVEYLKTKYGNNRVANIITFQTIGAKQSIRDVGRIYEFPTHHLDLLSKAIPDNKLSLREAYKKVPAFKNLVDSDTYYLNIIKLASKIEGLPRQSSIHAAGIVLNDTNLLDAIPVIIDSNGNYISQYEMNPLAEQGFLKMDLLGLRNLTILEKCIEKVNKNHNLNYNLETLPFDDEEVYKVISSTRTMGLFRLESSGIKNAIKLLEPSCFDDVVALLALFRPGPLNNIPIYANRKKGLEKTTYFAQSLEPILSSTYGIIVYQEQVLQVVTKIANFSLSKADLFRRAISKKDASKLEIMEKEFIEGAINNGYNKQIASTIYDHILRFADYGFKKAHSVAYSMLSCKMGYLKAFYPLEFYATILEQSSSSNDSKFGEYISEIKSFGLSLMLPSINESKKEYIVKDNGLLFPLLSIKGINNIISDDIIFEREKGKFTSFFDFVIRMSSYRINNSQIEKLIDAGALDEFNLSRKSMKSAILSILEYASMISSSYQIGDNYDDLLIPPPLISHIEDDPLEKLLKETESIGFMLSKTPIFYIKNRLKELSIRCLNDAKSSKNIITFAGIIKTFKTIKTKKGQPMSFVTLFDDDGEIEITIFPKLHAEKFMELKKNNIIIVTGKMDYNGSFIADELYRWEE